MTRISLFMLACCLSAIVLAEDWQAVKLKSGSVSYGSISEAGDSLSVDGKFTDISRIYDVLEEKDKFVRISDGTNSGWVSRARLTPVTNPAPAASDGPHPDKRSEANAAKDNDEANRTDPKTQVDYNNRGNERAVLNDFKGAIRDYDEAIRLNPGYKRVNVTFTNRGAAKAKLNDYEGAFRDFDEAIRLDPNFAVAFYNRGYAKLELKDHKSAIRDFDEAIRLDARYALAYSSRGWAKVGLKDNEGAITDFDEAIRLDPKNAVAYSSRGWAKVDLKKIEEAIRDYDEAIRLEPNHAWVYNNRGIAKRDLKDYEGAIRDFDEAIRLDPTFALQYDNRGSAKQNLKDYAEAIRDYDEAIRLDPKWTSALYKKSVVLSACPIETLRNAEQALNLAEQTLAIDANNAYGLNAKACAYALAGDFDAAVELQRKAMQNTEWIEDDSVDGGKLGGERIAKWESGKLWLLPK